MSMECGGHSRDLISELPESIIDYIFSRLPIKAVIIASSVSKTFRRLSIGYLLNAKSIEFEEDFEQDKAQDKKVKIMNKIIKMNKSEKIDRFKVTFRPLTKNHKSISAKWIRYATSKNVKVMELDFIRYSDEDIFDAKFADAPLNPELGGDFKLPGYVFDCESLKTLKLRRGILGAVENCGGFSQLSTLYLEKVLVTEKTLANVVLKCKRLQVLVLRECESLSRIRIISPALRILTVVCACDDALSLDIYGPNIQSLLISSREWKRPIVDSISCTAINLRDVIILNFRGAKSDMDLAAYFLRRSPVLKSMFLVTPRISNVSWSDEESDSSEEGENDLGSTSEEPKSFEEMEKDLSDLLHSHPEAARTANVRVISSSNEPNNLMSIFKLHHVSDVC